MGWTGVVLEIGPIMLIPDKIHSESINCLCGPMAFLYCRSARSARSRGHPCLMHSVASCHSGANEWWWARKLS